uniref:E3 ubiquitin-protein ligase RNF4-like n=1 Tax=Crassostrea virginica TaxID=6565 RepID=A0A8B8ENP0_CRAVI|nr:E3 ubiquitin-protein ligase RNF4-like [Crassostrea virginica]
MDLSQFLRISLRRPLHERRHRRQQQEANSGRSRRRLDNVVTINNEDADVPNGLCIDLTNGNEDFIDLTSPAPSGTNDASVIVIPGSSEPRRHRRNRRRPRTRSRQNRENSEDSMNDVIEVSESYHPIPLPLSFEDVDGTESTSSANNSITSPVQDISCPVCMDDKKQIKKSGRQMASTVCGHVFCEPCIKASIETQHRCPTCRKKLTQRQYHPLFI